MAAGPLLGVAWWLLAPTAPVRVLAQGADGGGPLAVAPGAPELAAAQDGTLLLLGLVAGAVTGAVVVLRGGSRPTSASLLAGLGALVGSVLAVALGQALGPEALTAQAPAGGGGAAGTLTSPLELHAPGVALVWPLAALVVAAGGHAVVARAQLPPA